MSQLVERQDRLRVGRDLIIHDPEIEADVAKFEMMLAKHKTGEVDDDVFRVFRLANGIYGQRQGGTNQMVRVKAPYGAITPEQLEMCADIAENNSRGWGHITTRQNIQFHFVQLDDVPNVMRKLGSVGMTTREACGDTVRNIQGCHLAGACPHEKLDITQWAEATFQHLLRHPFSQRLPRKFKINFSGCATDCGQAMFNDVGVIAVTRPTEDGSQEAGFRVFLAGGLGANPHPALALEPFTSREDLLPTIESALRVFEQTGNRDNRIRARMKWLVDTLGWEEVQRRVLAQRRLLPASSSWPGGIPSQVLEFGDAPAGRADGITPTVMGQGTPVAIRPKSESAHAQQDRWLDANVVRGTGNGTVSAYAWAHLGDVTPVQFRGLAAIIRDFGATARLTNRQNVVLRDLRDDQLPALFARLGELGMAEPGAELVRDVVSCPGADTCNLSITQSRGLARAIGDRLEEEGLADVGGVRINISGCMNSCGQHHTADIGFFGAERRAHGKTAPGYQMLLGGYVGEEKIEFGDKALRVPAKNGPEAVVRVVRQFAAERQAGESFRGWMERFGGATGIAAGLKDLDFFPAPDAAPDMYIDWDEVTAFDVTLGASECA
jgi:sulfite reductase beta subunit-like hemoprotein